MSCRDRPHLRGEQPTRASGWSTGEGTNPACAGTTQRRTHPASSAWDQPRRRGDHSPPNWSRFTVWGPTPQARGPRCGVPESGTVRGTNPAGAGTTGRRTGRRARRDQPRRRGDHSSVRAARLVDLGPTPQARGPPEDGRGGDLVSGTNPAGAGTTRGWTWRRSRVGDQPCRRGDHPRMDVAAISCRGPTLQARGPPRDVRSSRGRSGDQPRRRGDHLKVRLFVVQVPGPTPQARGPHAARCPFPPAGGTNPAGAGTTGSCTTGRCGRWDQPRRRGDHDVGFDVAVPCPGPTPQARGPQVVSCGFRKTMSCFYLVLAIRTSGLRVGCRSGGAAVVRGAIVAWGTAPAWYRWYM